MIRIPNEPQTEALLPLKRCLQKTADATGLTVFQVAHAMSVFFEGISDEVCANNMVKVPCFGTFGALAWKPRHDPDAPAFCYPAFSGAKPLRNAVKLQCPPSEPALRRMLRKANKDGYRHHGKTDSRTRMPHSAQAAFRDRIRAQAEKIGVKY